MAFESISIIDDFLKKKREEETKVQEV